MRIDILFLIALGVWVLVLLFCLVLLGVAAA